MDPPNHTNTKKRQGNTFTLRKISSTRWKQHESHRNIPRGTCCVCSSYMNTRMRFWSEAAALDRHAELLACARAPQQHSENVTAQLLLPAHFDWFVTHLNITIESLIKSNLRIYQNIVQLWISHLCSYLMNCLLRTWGHFTFICREKKQNKNTLH